ncbi:VOC family protein [Bacterioplanoides sp.]|uniref:VOC family protein n=1 Tax=Bacterioplanoides sp. TaxID=2066072 RepID=UPI003B5B2C7C
MMIRLEHANLVVQQIQPTLNFLKVAFPHWHVRGEGDMTWKRGALEVERHWLHFGNDDYYLTLNSNADAPMRDLNGNQAGLAHLGFVVDDLDALEQRLAEAGFVPAIVGQPHPYRKTLYYNEPGGAQFEFMQYLSEEPQQRNLYGGEQGTFKRN